MQTQSLRFVKILHVLHTRNRQAWHGAPRFIIRPKSDRHRAHERLLSMIIGRSSELPVLRAPFFLKLWSSARKSLFFGHRMDHNFSTFFFYLFIFGFS